MTDENQIGKRLRLEELIYQVKDEIMQAQINHQGELAFFEVEKVELEVKIGTTVTGKGTLDIWVLKLGEIGSARDSTHTVKLSFKITMATPFNVKNGMVGIDDPAVVTERCAKKIR